MLKYLLIRSVHATRGADAKFLMLSRANLPLNAVSALRREFEAAPGGPAGPKECAVSDSQDQVFKEQLGGSLVFVTGMVATTHAASEIAITNLMETHPDIAVGVLGAGIATMGAGLYCLGAEWRRRRANRQMYEALAELERIYVCSAPAEAKKETVCPADKPVAA